MGWIAVIAMAAVGLWVHAKRTEEAAVQASQARFTAGVWQKYRPGSSAPGPADGKVRLSGLRVIAPQTGFESQVAQKALDSHLRRVEEHAIETLASARPGTVLVRFITAPRHHDIQIKSQGNIDRQPLRDFQARLSKMERLRVSSGSVAFELSIAVSP